MKIAIAGTGYVGLSNAGECPIEDFLKSNPVNFKATLDREQVDTGVPCGAVFSLPSSTELEAVFDDPTKTKEKLGWIPEMVAYGLQQAKKHTLLKKMVTTSV